MQEIQHIEHLARPLEDLVLGQLAAGAEFVEHALKIAAGDELHHQVMTSGLDEIIDQAGNPGMRQEREHAGLAREVLDRFFLRDTVADDHLLAGDRAIGEAGIIRHVDAAHAADAEHLVDAIAAVEHVADDERLTGIHFVLRVSPTRRAKKRRGPLPRLIKKPDLCDRFND